jgi:SNF2 family DNA or RNA helicase
MFYVLSEAFHKNGIKFVICRSKADFSMFGSLGSFKSDSTVRVLIMLLSHGCHGVTITEASHVFLFEPILNSQQEAQAINRVYRIGQTRPTFIHKYIIKGTIEKRIHDITEKIFIEAGGAKNVLQNLVSESKSSKNDIGLLTLDQIEEVLGNEVEII